VVVLTVHGLLAVRWESSDVTASYATALVPKAMRVRFTNRFRLEKISMVSLEHVRFTLAVDVSALARMTDVGSRFLAGTLNLPTLDLSPLRHLTTIGPNFLYGCSGLTLLDLPEVTKVTVVNRGFLYDCSKLVSLDLTSLINVTSIDDDFLTGCASLVAIDLKPLSNVTSIGRNFCSNCAALTSIDLTPLVNAATVERQCLAGCKGLIAVRVLDKSSLYCAVCEDPRLWRLVQACESPERAAPLDATAQDLEGEDH
jgi:hypothetical protein